MRPLLLAGYVCIPLAFLSHFLVFKGQAFEPVVTFVLAGLGVLPLAHLMGESTEHLAHRTGPTWGGLLNATFGNAAELIIAVIALTKGANEIVKASITGSILGNLLLVAGAAMLVGGWKRKEQRFASGAAEAYGGLLMLGVAAMLVPAIFHFTAERLHDPLIARHDLSVSIGTAVVLLAVYALGLLFTLRTHSYLFSIDPHGKAVTAGPDGGSHDPVGPGSAPHGTTAPRAGSHGDADAPVWSVGRALTMLVLASVGVGVVAELLVGSAEATAHKLGWSPVFVGVILLAIIGNAAEHSTAVLLALKDDMDTAMTITYQSSLQIALFVAPVLVFVSLAFTGLGIGEATPLDLVFTPMEVVSVVLGVAIVVILGLNGRTNWFEGALLLALYALLALAFFNIPDAATATTRAVH